MDLYHLSDGIGIVTTPCLTAFPSFNPEFKIPCLVHDKCKYALTANVIEGNLFFPFMSKT